MQRIGAGNLSFRLCWPSGGQFPGGPVLMGAKSPLNPLLCLRRTGRSPKASWHVQAGSVGFYWPSLLPQEYTSNGYPPSVYRKLNKQYFKITSFTPRKMLSVELHLIPTSVVIFSWHRTLFLIVERGICQDGHMHQSGIVPFIWWSNCNIKDFL